MIFESVPCSEVFCITADVMIDKDLLCRPNDQSVMAQVLTLRRRYRLGRLGRSEVRVGTVDFEIVSTWVLDKETGNRFLLSVSALFDRFLKMETGDLIIVVFLLPGGIHRRPSG